MNETCPSCGQTIEAGLASCVYCGNLILEGGGSAEGLMPSAPPPAPQARPSSAPPPALCLPSSAPPPALSLPTSAPPPPPPPAPLGVASVPAAAGSVPLPPPPPPVQRPSPPAQQSRPVAPLPDLDALPPLPAFQGSAPALPGPVLAGPAQRDPDPSGLPVTSLGAPARTHSGLTGLLLDSSHRHETDGGLPSFDDQQLQLMVPSVPARPGASDPAAPGGRFSGSPGFLEDEARFAPSTRPDASSRGPSVGPEGRGSAPIPDARDVHAERIAAISGYGPAPRSPVYDMPYFVRVYMRKRALADELRQLLAVRKRAERKHEEALCQVGEVLYVHREDPALAPLSRSFQVVAAADADIDRHQFAGAAARRDALDEVERLEKKVDAAEHVMRPLEKLADKLEVQLATRRTRLAEAEAEARRTDAQVQKIREAAERAATDEAQLGFLVSQRDELSTRMAEIEAEIEPRSRELIQVRAKLTRQQAVTDELIAERDQLNDQTDREQRLHQRTAGHARGELRSALRTIGEAAIAQNLVDRAGPQVAQVGEMAVELERKRERVAMFRQALASYDSDAFQRGMYELVGGTAVLMLTLLYQIFIW